MYIHISVKKAAGDLWGEEGIPKVDEFCNVCGQCPGWYWRDKSCKHLDTYFDSSKQLPYRKKLKQLPAANRKLFALRVKARSDFRCEICGSTFLVDAHDPTGRHIDPNEGIALCAHCHAAMHPNMPLAVFFAEIKTRVWVNISAAEIARELGCCSRTVIRHATKLELPMSGYLRENMLSMLKADLGDYNKLRYGE